MAESDSLRSFLAQLFPDGRGEGVTVCLNHSTLFMAVGEDLYALTGLHSSITANNVDDYQFLDFMQLTLSSAPSKPISRISVNNASSYALVALEGGGLLLVTLPKSLWSIYKGGGGIKAHDEPLEHSYMCRSIPIELPDEEDPDVLQFCWHPDICTSFAVLFRNESLCYFDTSTGRFPTNVVNCGEGWNLNGSRNRFSAAPEERPVSFDFGMKKSHRTGDVWPVFVLFGNGDVYLTHFQAKDSREDRSLAGPLRMFPLDEDNYSMQAESLVCLRNMALPVLLIATGEGLVYHCVVVNEDADMSAESQLSYPNSDSLPMLLVKESVEIGDVDCRPCELRDDYPTRTQDILLVPGQAGKYVCARNGNFFHVSLDWCQHLLNIGGDGSVGSTKDIPSSISHVLALKTESSKLDCHPSCSNATVVNSTDRKSSNLVVFIAGHDPVTVALKNSVGIIRHVESPEYDKPNFIDHIAEILSKTNTQPIVKLPESHDADEKVMLDVVCEATATLRQEYISRLVMALQEFTKRVNYLQHLKSQQATLLSQFPETCSLTSTRNANLKQRCSAVHERQRLLAGRLENLLDLLRSSGGIVSADEERSFAEVKKIQSQLDQLKTKFDEMKDMVPTQSSAKLESKTPPSSQSPGKTDSLTIRQTIRLKALLQEQQEEVESLVQSLASSSQRVGLK